MDAATLFELLRNSPAFLDKKLVLSEEFIFKKLKEEMNSIVKFDIKDQQLFFGIEIQKWGFHYLYEMDIKYVAEGTNLNSSPRQFVFKEISSRVIPNNLAAKMLPFSTVFIPKIGPLLKFVVKIIIRQLIS